MRGKKAKAIRKLIYGDNDIRVKEYKEGHEPQMMEIAGKKVDGAVRFKPNPTVICVKFRRMYKNLKALVQVMGKKPTVYEAYKMLN